MEKLERGPLPALYRDWFEGGRINTDQIGITAETTDEELKERAEEDYSFFRNYKEEPTDLCWILDELKAARDELRGEATYRNFDLELSQALNDWEEEETDNSQEV